MGIDRRPAQSALLHWRAALSGGTALVRVGLAAVTVSGALAALIVTTPAALADGGRGGGGPTDVPGGGDGATGTGGNGSDGIDDIFIASGGGGGGAGAAAGGAGGAGYGGPLGGAGGLTPGANGADGTDVIGALSGGGGGGGGVHGAVISASRALFASSGGNGGNGGGFSVGGPAGPVGGGGGGGAGGYGTVIGRAGLSLTNSANLIGGNGGAGGRGGHGGGSGGSGGSGGIGLDFVTTSNVLLNGGFIAGGAGGAGGVGQGVDINGGGNGGNGGAGIVASGLVVTNTGAITGGTGGAAGTAPFGIWGQAGVGGVGLIGANISIINSGTISGGMSGDGLTRANAITFTGGANMLRFLNGTSGLIGNMDVAGSLTFDQNGIDTVVANTITGTGSVIKTGSAMVTLSGINTYSGGTTINAGTLSISSDANLGNSSGGLTFNGGTLQITGGANLASTRAITLNSGGGTFDIAGLTTFSQSFGGSGPVTFTNGAAFLLAPNIYSGATTVTSTGILGANTAGALSPNSDFTVNGLLMLNGFDNTIKSLSGSGDVVNGVFGATPAATLTIAPTSGITSFSGNLIDGIGDLLSLTKTGGGTQVLSGANTYSGGTTISAGTLRADTDTALGTGLVTLAGGTLLGGGAGVTLANDIAFNAGATSTISAGATTMTLAGRMDLSYNSVARFGIAGDTGTITANFLGPTPVSPLAAIEINGGTVRALNDQFSFVTTIAASTSVATGATLDFNDQVDLTNRSIRHLIGAGTINIGSNGATTLNVSGGDFSGAISGAGGLRIGDAQGFVGTKHLTLSGMSTYIGPTTISTGNILQLGNGGTTGAIGTGAVSNSGALVFNRSNAFNFANLISGSGELRQQGTGTTTLSGINTYTGATTVNAGTLSVNGAISSSSLTTVNPRGTLGGNGTVGDTAINGGTLSPGNSIGALTVAGSLTLAAASTYMVEVSPTASDFTHVTGSATLNGAKVTAEYAPGSYVNKRYTILTADGGVSGTFSGPLNTNLPTNFKTALAYDGNNAFLDLKLVYAPPGGPLNVNQSNVANTLTNFFNSTGGIPLAFGALTPQGLTQASGELGTGTQQATFNAMGLFMGVMTDPFMAGRGASTAPSGNASSFAADDEALGYAARGNGRTTSERDAYAAMARKALPMVPSFERRWNVWAAGYGGSQTTSGNNVVGSNTATSSLYGVAVGADYHLSPDTLVGFAMAGGATGFNVANGLGSGRSDLFQAGAFVRHHIGAAYLSGALAYGWQDVTTDRTVTTGGIERLHANFNADAFSGRLEGGYRIATPYMGITPYAAGQFTTYDLPAYAEQSSAGSLFALNYAAKNVTSSRSELGVRTDKSFALDNAILTLRSRAAWAHNFDTDRSIAATFQSLPGASFVVNGAAQAREAALVTGSAEMKWANGFALAATFEGEFSDTTTSYSGKGVVRYSW